MNTATLQNEKKKTMVPQLRFPEFEGEWEKSKLGKLGTFIGGGTPSTSYEDYWKGDIPWISSSDISEDDLHNININRYLTDIAIKVSATKIIPKNSILLVSRVGVGKLAINKVELCTSQDFSNFIPSKDDSVYIGYYLISKKNILVNFSQGTSIKGFTTSDVKTFPINIPTLPEQQKIASFLSAVHEKIQQLSRKKELLEQYKKGVMQQLFSGKLRFKDENGKDYPDWEEKKLGDVGEVKMCKRIFNDDTSPEGDIPFYKIGSFGKIADAFITKDKYLDFRKKYSFPKKGDILISAAGTIGRTVVYNGEDAYYQDSNIVWISNDYSTVSNEFLFYIYQIVTYNTEGGTIQRLYNNILKSTKFTCPSLPEQQKIADFLSGIDAKIEHTNQQLAQAQRFKKGLLQQMFV